ncbi:histidine kinase, partial [Vibrio sp. Vb2362]|nr:histidine kinase [Vibrio sp. Vb2362]
DWELAERYCTVLKLTEPQLADAFNQSTEWAQELLSQTP